MGKAGYGYKVVKNILDRVDITCKKSWKRRYHVSLTEQTQRAHMVGIWV